MGPILRLQQSVSESLTHLLYPRPAEIAAEREPSPESVSASSTIEAVRMAQATSPSSPGIRSLPLPTVRPRGFDAYA